MLHQLKSSFQLPLVASADDRKLLDLCRRAERALREDERLETIFSELTDSFVDVKKPERPNAGAFPPSYLEMSSAEARTRLQEARRTPKHLIEIWKLGLLASGKFDALVKDKSIYEKALHDLETAHGLTAAEKAAKRAARKTREIIAQVAITPALTAIGLASKCRVMKVTIETGWGHHDEFEELAHSIYEDGALLLDAPKSGRPRRSHVDHPAHH